MMNNSINPTDPNYVAQLQSIAAGAVSMQASDREAAEKQIKGYKEATDRQLGFVCLLLHVVATGGPAAPFCSIVLKNTVKECWNPSTSEHCIQEQDKAVLRDAIIGVMLEAPPATQRNLAETIALIADIDFPLQWPLALDLIVKTLASSAPLPTQCAALSTAHSILIKYREGEMSESFASELRTVYTALLMPLITCMGGLLEVSERAEGQMVVEACRGLISAVECLVDITSLDVTDEFVANLNTIVDVLLRCLSLSNPALFTGGSPSPAVVELKSVVIACGNHFLTQFDEDFVAQTPKFLQVVWGMLADPSSAAPEMDDLIVCGLELLSSACAGTAREVFDNQDLVQNLVSQVVIPNLMLQPEDVNMYTNEPDSYILRDVEGSDLHTRRRAAGELVRTLVKYVPHQSKPLLTAEVNRLFAVATSDWLAKDAGIFLASSLALEGQHVDANRGVTQQLSSLIPFEQFLQTTIIPELNTDISPSSPGIIKADCIRVLSTFRYQISPSHLRNLLPLLPMWLGSPDPVIVSYTAHALERFLLVQHQNQYVVTEAIFAPHAALILQRLCTRILETEQPNAYLAQCLMRVCQRVGGTVAPYVGDVVLSMNTLLHQASKNPSNPLFSHCLFETLSKCIALAPLQAATIEHTLWENLIYILSNDVLEYVPYALQIMAQLLDSYKDKSSEPPAHYQGLLEPLTQPSMYEQKGNVPAVVCLLTVFISNYPGYVYSLGLSDKILNIFGFLVQLKNYDHEGLNILTAMILSYPPDVMGTYLNRALQVLLERLQRAKTPKYVRIFILFLSITVCVRGPEDLVTRMNGIQKGLFFMILEKVWLANMQKIIGKFERKVCIVALARLLCESRELQASKEAWAHSVYSCLKMIHGSVEEDDRTSFAPKLGTVGELGKKQVDTVGFTNVFCPLEAAVRPPVDVCAAVVDPDQYFRDHMKQLLNGPGASLIAVLQQALQPELLALIQ